jgi:hypothetical protein
MKPNTKKLSEAQASTTGSLRAQLDASEIETGVPVPRGGSGRRHAYEERMLALEPGQSFTVPWSKQNSVRSWLTGHRRRNPTKKFVTSRVEERLRIWRVE